MIRRANRVATAAATVATVAMIFTLGVFAASAMIPPVDRTMMEIAKVNRASGRTKAIQMELTMSVGGRPPIASGELISHPSGLARLEIRGFRGRVDRYLLSGNELLGAKDGLPIERPQPILQPLFLIQPASETTLRAALKTFGVDTEWIGLAPCGERDCFVIGDPRLAAPVPHAPDFMTDEEAASLDEILEGLSVKTELSFQANRNEEFDGLSFPFRQIDGQIDSRMNGQMDEPGDFTYSEGGSIPRIWVDTQELQVRRIDRASGVFVVFGPIQSFDKLKVPGWFEIHEPGAEAIRFEVDRAVAVNAPPQAFSRKWLMAPTPTSTPVPTTEEEHPGSDSVEAPAAFDEQFAP